MRHNRRIAIYINVTACDRDRIFRSLSVKTIQYSCRWIPRMKCVGRSHLKKVPGEQLVDRKFFCVLPSNYGSEGHEDHIQICLKGPRKRQAWGAESYIYLSPDNVFSGGQIDMLCNGEYVATITFKICFEKDNSKAKRDDLRQRNPSEGTKAPSSPVEMHEISVPEMEVNVKPPEEVKKVLFRKPSEPLEKKGLRC